MTSSDFTTSTERPLLERVSVIANDRVLSGVSLVALHAPRVAATARPGNFVHLRITDRTDVLLRRPFSVHRATGDTVELLYQVLGPGTRLMAEMRVGDETDIIGPLGRGFSAPEDLAHALVVAGGLGAAPLGMLAERLSARGTAVTVALGAPNAERLVARETFESVARRVEVATDDGSAGHHGYVTELVERLIAEDTPGMVYACGPEPMSRTVAEIASAAGVRCEVSLERLMACGVGACLTCVVQTTEGLRRACKEGPVFDAAEVLW